MEDNIDLIIRNIGMLATPQGKTALGGKSQAEIKLINNAFIAVKGDRIVAIGEEDELRDVSTKETTALIDAEGCFVTPGLVDPHTHLVFAGWRQKELALKLKGSFLIY